MVSSFIIAALLVPVIAYPITQTASCQAEQAIDILEYDQLDQHVRFGFPYSVSGPDEALVFDVGASPCRESASAHCLEVIINGQALRLEPDSAPSSDLVSSATQITTNVTDLLGTQHTLQLRANVAAVLDITSGNRGASYQFASHSLEVDVQSLDDRPIEDSSFTINWSRSASGEAHLARLQIMQSEKVESLDFKCLSTESLSFVGSQDGIDDVAEEEYILGELKALRLLEQQALELQHEIAFRKQAISTRAAEYRSRKSLKELIDQCDGVICAAKEVATRICDSINLATSTRDGYTRLQQPLRVNSTHDDASNATHQDQFTTNRQFREELSSSDDYFLKALTFIASALGLTAIFAFIKRKCMSMRNRVERAADLEERRTARAYRRAARRAEMRSRWTNFVQSFNCLYVKTKQPPRMTSYDEKRALILQDALLEQDFSQLEKGDLMEAEIRELRHAHVIVSNIVSGSGRKPGLLPARDLPPSLVPLPQSSARSRASTGTLPSYNSEDLPEYSSLIYPTDQTAATRNTTTDRYAGHYVVRAPQSSSSSRTRSTPVSSIPALSPRVSAETLRTRSRGFSQCSE